MSKRKLAVLDGSEPRYVYAAEISSMVGFCLTPSPSGLTVSYIALRLWRGVRTASRDRQFGRRDCSRTDSRDSVSESVATPSPLFICGAPL